MAALQAATPGERFNEARADSPGRLAGFRARAQRHGGASMRPGPIRPGDW